MKYVKYRGQKQQVSYDGGETWEDTGKVRKGEYLGVYDTAEECANATVPPHETVPPQAHTGAKATFILDDGTEFDLPFTGFQSVGDSYFTDDYTFTKYDTAMALRNMSRANQDYIAQHCVSIIISERVTCVCEYLESVMDCGYQPYGNLVFEPEGTIANDRREYYHNLQEIVIQDSTRYVAMDGFWTQVTKLRLPESLYHLELNNFEYINSEFTIPESFTTGVTDCKGHVYKCNNMNKLVSYTDSTPYPFDQYWSGYGSIPRTMLLYSSVVPSRKITDLSDMTYVRDELLSAWQGAYRNGSDIHSTRRYYSIFFPLSYYNTDFRNPNDNEKFVARLSDGTLYSAPIGNGVVTSGDVIDIQSKICDIKFGSGVISIKKGVFGISGISDSLHPRHHINLLEFNSDVDLSDCDTSISIDKVKLNGNAFFGSFQSVYTRIGGNGLYGAVREIYVPDAAFESYVKSLPLGKDNIRLKLRQMSRFEIND